MAMVTVLKQYFGSEGYPEVTTKELTDLKKADPQGLKKLADGIEDGTFDYDPS